MLEMLERARWIEAEAWTDVVAGAPADLSAALGLASVRWGAATLLRAARVDSLLFNRVLGIVDTGHDVEGIVAEAVRCFEVAGVRRYFVHAPAGDPRWAALMQRHGLVAFHRPWVKLVRGRQGPTVSSACALEIGACRPDEAQVWAQVLAEGLEIDDAGIVLLAAMVGRDGWTTLVARDGDEVVGAAAMFVRGETASLTGAATRPSHRRRGIQRALMARRVTMALDLGCVAVASETGIAVPDQPNSSCNNMMRCGLEIVGTVDNYGPPQTRWSRR
jgi:GNAT superfamily N-acetyltransferase